MDWDRLERLESSSSPAHYLQYASQQLSLSSPNSRFQYFELENRPGYLEVRAHTGRQIHDMPVIGRKPLKNLKEEILTIRSPTAEENNDSGIENNRNSSSHSPSTSLDFSPRSTDFLSPKSHTSSTENLPPPPPPPSLPPAEASPEPTRHLDQVLIPIPTTGATTLHRPSPLEETVDYPPPPHHLRLQSSVDKTSKPQSETDLLTPNKARISATIPSSSYLREHTKVEPFVAQSIREHQVVTKKLPETNVDLTVELNREQKAIVSTSKFPNRESSTSKRSETAANSSFPSETINSQYRFGATEEYPQEKNNRTTSYYQYRTNQQNESSTNRSTPTIQASRSLSHSVSTPAVSGNTMISNAPSPSTTTLYRAVDIPFDDSSSSSIYHPPKRDKDGLIAITIELGAQPVHKGFGFSVNCEKRYCLVDAVVVGTPADKQGLQIGDRIDSINGEKTADQFPSAINRAIHEATRMGEIHLRIERKDVRTFTSTSNSLTNKYNDASSTSKFKQTRSMFNSEKQVESYSEFKRKHSRTPRDYPAARDYNSLPRSTSTSVNSYESLPRRREQSMHSSYGHSNVREPFGGSSRSLSSSDYRVTSLHDKVGPGKLSDFVPEVERSRLEDSPRRRVVDSEETPRTIRNYQVSSNELGYRPQVHQTQHQNSGSSYKPPAEINNYNYIDEHNSQPHVKSSSSTEVHVPISILKTSSLTGQIKQENRLKQEQHRPEEHHYTTLENIRKALREPVTRTIPIEVLRPVGEVPLTPVTHISEYDIVSDGDESDDHLYQRMHQKQPFHTVRLYGISREAPTTPRSRSVMTSYASVPELRSKSSESLDISNVSHRFYDRDGNHVYRDQIVPDSMPIKIRREYGEYKYRSEEKTFVETRDWRDIINQQRQAAPGQTVDNQKIRDVTASMSNLPSIIDRKHEESKKLVREQNDYHYQNRDWKQSQPEIQTSRTESHSGYNSLGYKPKPTNNFNNNSSYKSNTLREEVSRYDDYQSKTVINSSTMQSSQKEAKEYTPSGYKEDKQENVVAVSGKHRCAHCSTELGRGAAMIVESLNLYYHLACFKCFVCKTPLGSGATGTDVRVREGRLHCQSCYSNDKLQLSKV
ncbi:unnamed protein product [Auanema sp. JU1783]|nr:unnamed protein product [Auanema sp. JU1783]